MARRATSAEIVAALDVMTVVGDAEVTEAALREVVVRLARQYRDDYTELDWREERLYEQFHG